MMTKEDYDMAVRATRIARVRMAEEIIDYIHLLQDKENLPEKIEPFVFTNMLILRTEEDRKELGLPSLIGAGI